MKRCALLPLVFFFAAAGFAQAPQFQHAHLTSAAATNLSVQLKMAETSSSALWWGFNVIGHQHCGTVYLDGRKPSAAGPVHVLFHIENHAVVSIRPIGGQCTIDAAGENVLWLINADPAQSSRLLASLAAEHVSGALAALAESDGADATAALIRLAQSAPAPHLRGQALFWLAQRASKNAIGVIRLAIANDPDTRVKERAVFALSQLPAAQGVPQLIHVAETNSNPAVRKRAMFWLGQSNDPRALAFFKTILTH